MNKAQTLEIRTFMGYFNPRLIKWQLQTLSQGKRNYFDKIILTREGCKGVVFLAFNSL